MSGIFPKNTDGALPPNPADKTNPLAAYPPATPPANTSALYFGNGCDVRLRPEVINSIISEIAATVDQANLAYDHTRLENLELATRYLIQRGLQTGTVLSGGPNDFYCVLDPPLTGYNNYLTLIVVPSVDNAGAVTVNVDGRGAVPVFRNDAQPLQARDLRGGMPALISYYGGFFFHVGMCASQIPAPYVPPPEIIDLGLWVRPDGNDANNGSANDPAQAFRTVTGAFQAAMARFAHSPQSVLTIMLGIPGNYEGFYLGPFGGTIVVQGDPANRSGYRFSSYPSGNNWQRTMAINAVASCRLIGMTALSDYGGSNSPRVVSAGGSANIMFQDCDIEVTAAHDWSELIQIESGAALGFSGTVNIIGNGNRVGCYFSTYSGSMGAGGAVTLNISNCAFVQMGCYATQLSVHDYSYSTINSPGCTGRQFVVEQNSILRMRGQSPPGNQPGIVQTGGQYIGN